MIKKDNCYHCEYNCGDIDGGIQCNRRLPYDGKIVFISDEKLDKVCPCNSRRDFIKETGGKIDDGLFEVSYEKLLELQKIIFG